MKEQTSPIDQTLKQCMRVKDLPPSLYIDLVIQIHHHFVSRFLIDSLHERRFCSSYKEVQKYECNSAVVKCSHTIKSVQSICCWQCWPQLGDTKLSTHSMEWVLLHMLYWVVPQSGDSYAELWKWMSYKQLGTTTLVIDFFCGDRPPETLNTKCLMLRWHQSNNRSSAENVLVVSLSTPSLVC